MVKIKIKDKLGARVVMKKNPFLRFNGSFDLIEIFPVYKDKGKQKIKR